MGWSGWSRRHTYGIEGRRRGGVADVVHHRWCAIERRHRGLFALISRSARDKAIPYEWQPPSAQKANDDTLTAHMARGWHIRAVPTGLPEHLATVAAKQAFWQMGPAMLQKIGRHCGVEALRGLGTFDLIYNLVKHVLRCSDAEALAVCEKRFLSPGPACVANVGGGVAMVAHVARASFGHALRRSPFQLRFRLSRIDLCRRWHIQNSAGLSVPGASFILRALVPSRQSHVCCMSYVFAPPCRFNEPPHIPSDAMDILLQMDEAIQMADPSEHEKFVAQKEKAKTYKQERAELITAYSQKRKVVRGAGEPCVNTSATKKKQKESAKSGRRVYPPTFPVGDVTQRELSALAPPGAHVWHDRQHGGWQGHYPPFPRIGRSWSCHGGCRNAGILVLQELWSRWSAHNAVPEASCPIRDLFDLVVHDSSEPPRPASSSAAASSSGAR